MLEVCHTIAICIDRNRMFVNRLNVEYTLDLAVRNVERLNVSSFVMGVHMSAFLIFYIMDFAYLLTWVTQTSHGKAKKNMCVFPVTRPTLIFPSDPKVFIGIPKIKRNLPYLRPFLLVLPLSLSYLKLYCCFKHLF